jgi:hypothetical protein
MGATVFRDLMRRVESAVTFNELRALRRFARRRLEADERLPQLDEAIEQRAMAMIATAELAAREAEAR